MGRKGIGKLSVFSIAQTVSVYSTKGGESNGLRIKVKDLENAINANLALLPRAHRRFPSAYRRQGTIIVLDDLKRKRADLTAIALRKRLARRFDVIDQTPRDKGGFYIEVNGKRITYADRQELKQSGVHLGVRAEDDPGQRFRQGLPASWLQTHGQQGRGWRVSRLDRHGRETVRANR